MATNVVTKFVLDVVERAVKTAAQSALAVYGVDTVMNVASFQQLGAIAGSAAVLSILTSLASQPVAQKNTASLISQAAPAVHTESAVADPVSVDSLAVANEIFPATS